MIESQVHCFRNSSNDSQKILQKYIQSLIQGLLQKILNRFLQIFLQLAFLKHSLDFTRYGSRKSSRTFQQNNADTSNNFHRLFWKFSFLESTPWIFRIFFINFSPVVTPGISTGESTKLHLFFFSRYLFRDFSGR